MFEENRKENDCSNTNNNNNSRHNRQAQHHDVLRSSRSTPISSPNSKKFVSKERTFRFVGAIFFFRFRFLMCLVCFSETHVVEMHMKMKLLLAHRILIVECKNMLISKILSTKLLRKYYFSDPNLTQKKKLFV